MAFNRTTAAVLLVAASIPALANTAPLLPAPTCIAQVEDSLFSMLQSPAGAPIWTQPSTTGALDSVLQRELLAAFAMRLRDVRYRAGGRAPTTGFDCSGFVQYVFAHTLGVDLPDDSASQFRGGTRVARAELKTGDLVFFHTRGKAVSHVGIYLDHGRFIHSPSTGKRVRVDALTDPYWSQHFLAAKRPRVLI